MSWPSSLWLTCMVSVIFGHVHSLDAGHCEAENADCTDTIPANSTPRSCLRLIMAGDAHAAALCFSRCVALETESTCPNENAFVVTAAEVGATQQVDRALVQPLLKQIPLERWAARETPLAAIKAIRPVLGLLHHPADVVVFLREYMLALWAAECYAALVCPGIVPSSTCPRHPLPLTTRTHTTFSHSLIFQLVTETFLKVHVSLHPIESDTARLVGTPTTNSAIEKH
eukprot:m.19914 g.19914  ORF g.19914 m.19914 type:complete len:228 (+) comp5502_c0_seq1:220-903(+)